MQNGSDTLGIGIAGGRFTCGYDTPIYVTNVQPDGCLAKTGQISVVYKISMLLIRSKLNPFTADPVKALHFAMLM